MHSDSEPFFVFSNLVQKVQQCGDVKHIMTLHLCLCFNSLIIVTLSKEPTLSDDNDF